MLLLQKSECAQQDGFIRFANSNSRQDKQPDPPRETSEVLVPQPDTMQAPAESSSVIEADTFDDRGGSQALFAKYNLDIVQPKWPTRNNPPVERVPKPIRMRVRYTCHRCLNSFGHDRDCNSCGHRRCAHCKRYPPRKLRPDSEYHGPTSDPAPPVKEAAPDESGPNHSQTLCTCHECQTVLGADIKNCPNCRHKICQKCHIEAQWQKPNGVDVDMRSPTEEATRHSQPEEQKLPPDSSTTQEDQSR